MYGFHQKPLVTLYDCDFFSVENPRYIRHLQAQVFFAIELKPRIACQSARHALKTSLNGGCNAELQAKSRRLDAVPNLVKIILMIQMLSFRPYLNLFNRESAGATGH